MPPSAPPARAGRVKQRAQHVTALELRAEEALPPGVCGRIQGVAMIYNQTDWYGTQFAPGCMSKSIAERVAQNKVNLFLDHEKEVGCHVGIVRTITDVGDAAIMVAELLDTEDGRSALEYCKAVIAAGGETGLSIGFIARKGEVIKDQIGTATGEYRFLEIELRETSITPVPAVEGALLTGARNEDENNPELLVTALRGIFAALPKERLDEALLEYGFQRNLSTESEEIGAAAAEEPAAPSTEEEGSRKMPVDERVALMRAALAST